MRTDKLTGEFMSCNSLI